MPVPSEDIGRVVGALEADVRSLTSRVDRLEEVFERRLNNLDGKIDAMISQISGLTSAIASAKSIKQTLTFLATLAIGASGWVTLLTMHWGGK